MKSKILFLFLFVTSLGFSQSINNYSGVIIPLRYEFMKSDNQYRMCTLTKSNLKKAGFVAFYANEELPQQYYNNRCGLLNVEVIKDNAFLMTKLFIVFKDCNNKEIFKSEVGKSKEKDYEAAYSEALNRAFESVYALEYKYDGTVVNNGTALVAPAVAATVPVVPTASVPTNTTEPDATVLFAQPIKNGYQLVDSTPKVVMKAYKTSNPSMYQAIKGNIQGAMVLKDNQWFFEYYENDNLMSEKINVKF
ncbi:hypothetical protein [Flavobacterium adhaerens]|uniref:hypothetical protein n=1 Tax=Flavobacterium adhaerens TaxID=3149043 RepID=UPI0032B31509